MTNATETTHVAEPQQDRAGDVRDRFADVLEDFDFETQDRRYGPDYQETVRRLVGQGSYSMSYQHYRRNYQADVSKEVDNLINMFCHMTLDNKMPPSAVALWDYGTRLTHEPNGFINRVGHMIALQAFIETLGVCEGLAERLQRELARY